MVPSKYALSEMNTLSKVRSPNSVRMLVTGNQELQLIRDILQRLIVHELLPRQSSDLADAADSVVRA